ncbi:dethiobiotin synthetase [Thermosulfidibacter takaii ABI70S6]|uniref:ATP-dependent dethiobiotin synthetase BioD n=1 Tax=Thermosulfidibacter takaii (strain DSM 17441 / JCM 13301 / NBRC 103674 / ABI70S6) TaxID=1298851 RepID=A0A0S3QUS0_THET7|nr:dethiobiotin synthase [Thermosulfidibacter takaii]BAT72088.1 dethiobiotin synthetase [Thermosulfidibacter takaii ABI70S6]
MGLAFLVTGTDTGVGKTYVARGLIKAFVAKGLVTLPFKPVETGCLDYPMDGRALVEAAQCNIKDEEVVPLLFKEPLAPAVAEKIEGKRIDLHFLTEKFLQLKKKSDILVIEGAGGLLVPVTGKFTYADLANLWDLPLVVVARSKLGTINHTLLTLRVARAQGLKVLAVVLNGYEGADVAERTNPEVIEELGDIKVFLIGKSDEPPALTELAEYVYENLEGSLS